MSDLVEVLARSALIAEVGGDVWDKLEDKHRTVGKERAQRFAAALEAAGYRVVPVEPTEEMKVTARRYFGIEPDGRQMDRLFVEAFRSMCRAAPKVTK